MSSTSQGLIQVDRRLVTMRRESRQEQFFLRADIGYPERDIVMTRPLKRTVEFDGRPIWAEVSLGALTHNLRAIRRHVNPARTRSPQRKILAVIKSNAYG